MVNIFQICLTIAVAVIPYIYAAVHSENREWERWNDDGVSQSIHDYWIRSQGEIQHRKTLAQLVKSLYRAGDHFLEAGCGSGLVYQQLVPHVMDNQYYVGIDITQTMLDIAHADHPNGIFLQDDLYHLSYKNNSFEIVAAFEVLGHLPSIEIPIREMCRVASRLVVFTVWPSHATAVTEERFRNSTFLHRTFSHADILKAIENSMDVEYTVRTIALNEHTLAYIISK